MKKRQIGVWLNYDKAEIISNTEPGSGLKTIESGVEHFKAIGGSSAKVPWGPVETISESKLQNRREQQLKKYFSKIAEQFQEDDDIILFGPAEAKLKFDQFLKNYKKVKIEVLSVKTVQYLTDNQKLAYVRNHFENK